MLEEIKQNQENPKENGKEKGKVGYGNPPVEHQIKPGEIRNPKGRGSIPNRSTIAKLVLNMKVSPPEEILRGLRQMYPNFFNKKSKKWTNELLASLRQTQKAIIKGDTRALEIMLDSAYGKAKESVELGSGEMPIEIIIKKGDPTKN